MPSLLCPETHLQLRETDKADAEQLIGALHSRQGSQFAHADRVLLRADNAAAYPIVKGIPILLAPEVLTANPTSHDLRDSRWAEAFQEMDFYNSSAMQFSADLPNSVARLKSLTPPLDARWIDSPYDASSQAEAFEHLSPLEGKILLQLGGKGLHAVQFLLSGAREAYLVTPMISEVIYARKLADLVGVGHRFYGVVGVAEQLPFEDTSLDGIYAGGCLHHMATRYAGPEIRRVLRYGGRFAAVEPWKTFMHTVGTGLIGKREPNAFCSPLSKERLTPMYAEFPDMVVNHHGPVLRYAALAFAKFRRRDITVSTGLRLDRYDAKLPLPNRLGGSVSVLALRASNSS